jgi:predicted nucleotidyltransferase component of viral defense system
VTRPTRATLAGRAYLDLQQQARRDARPFDELLALYTLEGFLTRLAGSQHKSNLVLKGGLLLAAYDARRPTRDADFAARQVTNDVEEVTRLVQEIAAIRADDGLAFDIDSARGEVIRDEDAYSGVRVHLDCRLASAKTYLNVDVNVGDPISPAPEPIHIPRLLDKGETIDLVGYPLAMIHAEKIVTALQRGTVNTRSRDFADIYLLSRQHPIDGADLEMALQAVAQHRGAHLAPLAEALAGYAEVPGVQSKWSAWRRRQQLDDRLPESFADVLEQVYPFTDPAIAGRTANAQWLPGDLAWRTGGRHA